MKDIVVLYHQGCLDGFSASWVAWTKFGDKADYISVLHQLPPPEGLINKTIYFVDFIYPKEVLQEILDKNKVVVLDHHESVEDVIKSVSEHRYDSARSGAVIAWQYFWPERQVPKFLKYVEDVDLWLLQLPHTEEIIAFLDAQHFSFKRWNELVRDFDDPKIFERYVAEGQIMLKYKEDLVNEIAKEADLVEFEGYKILAVNCANTSALTSDLGSFLYKKKPPFSIIWSKQASGINVSMRSNSSVNVADIAKKFGGGGHPGAAGFKLKPEDQIPWTYVQESKKT